MCSGENTHTHTHTYKKNLTRPSKKWQKCYLSARRRDETELFTIDISYRYSGVHRTARHFLCPTICWYIVTNKVTLWSASYSACVVLGAIIRDGDVLSPCMIWDDFSIFRTNCAIACGTRAYMLRGFSRMSRGKSGVWSSRNRVWFWPQINAFMAVGILLKYFNFVVSCFSLSEDSAEFRYVPLYIADQVEFRCSFYENFTLLHSKFHIWRRLTAFS